MDRYIDRKPNWRASIKTSTFVCKKHDHLWAKLNFNNKWLLFYCLFECRRVLFSTLYAPKRVFRSYNSSNIFAQIYSLLAHLIEGKGREKTTCTRISESLLFLCWRILVYNFPFGLRKFNSFTSNYRKHFGERRAFGSQFRLGTR